MTADINVEIRELIFREHHKCYATVRLDRCMDKMFAVENIYLKMDILPLFKCKSGLNEFSLSLLVFLASRFP